MADESQGVITPPTNSEINELRNALTMTDCYSQNGFTQIASIARLVLMSLETKTAYLHFDHIAIALEAIIEKADDIKNCINCEAESVGCNFIDEEKRNNRKSRRAAYRRCNHDNQI